MNNFNYKCSNEDQLLSIPESYSNKTIFITGASGFLGKILLEKLLRSCPNIKNIYLLMRSKNNKEIHERLQEIFNAPLFDIIREKQPKSFEKVIAIGGDMRSDELGISEEEQKVLTQNVSIVFHSAATVRFDEKIRDAVDINVRGTQRLIDLCRNMVDLKAFVYISTAYSNCDKCDVEEIFYEFPFNSQAIVDLTKNFSDEFLDKCTKHILGNRPNTYTLTKAIVEDILKRECQLPIAIIRPSIIGATSLNPFPGWMDSWFGATSLIAALGKGIFHTMICGPNVIADFIPADIVVNATIAAAWQKEQLQSPEKLIYNVTSSIKNKLTWGEYCLHVISAVRKYPFEGTFWYPTLLITDNHLTNKMYSALFHYIPAYIFDAISRIFGKKPGMVKIQDKLNTVNKALDYFKLTEIKFYGHNADKLGMSMNNEDLKNFPIDVSEVNWKKYIEDYVLGIRQYVFKQNPDTIDECRRKMLGLKTLHYIFKAILVLLMVLFLLFQLNIFETLLLWLIQDV